MATFVLPAMNGDQLLADMLMVRTDPRFAEITVQYHGDDAKERHCAMMRLCIAAAIGHAALCGAMGPADATAK